MNDPIAAFLAEEQRKLSMRQWGAPPQEASTPNHVWMKNADTGEDEEVEITAVVEDRIPVKKKDVGVGQYFVGFLVADYYIAWCEDKDAMDKLYEHHIPDAHAKIKVWVDEEGEIHTGDINAAEPEALINQTIKLVKLSSPTYNCIVRYGDGIRHYACSSERGMNNLYHHHVSDQHAKVFITLDEEGELVERNVHAAEPEVLLERGRKMVKTAKELGQYHLVVLFRDYDHYVLQSKEALDTLYNLVSDDHAKCKVTVDDKGALDFDDVHAAEMGALLKNAAALVKIVNPEHSVVVLYEEYSSYACDCEEGMNELFEIHVSNDNAKAKFTKRADGVAVPHDDLNAADPYPLKVEGMKAVMGTFINF